jgi:hypothetical protein
MKTPAQPAALIWNMTRKPVRSAARSAGKQKKRGSRRSTTTSLQVSEVDKALNKEFYEEEL